ncbi:MAG: hypothetical protein ACAH89_06770 [Rariglobus sp.]|nr:hypothetical protein [Rariglobus sp.]
MINSLVPTPRSAESRSGFALLITITLLAFLVLLLVSLATLTRVETQVAANGQQFAQARQNALMALSIALGELQKYAGPDQRTSVPADLDAALAVSTKSGRWLGIYGSGVSASYADTPTVIADKIAADAAAGPANGSQARLVNWLVSGNEGTAFDPSAGVGTAGNITAPPSVFQFTPNGTVSGLVGSTALSTDITVADKDGAPQPARLLIGANTVGTDGASASLASYVVAPLKEVSAVVPGLGNTAVPVGRYAWWVGDEGAKARVNLPLATAAQARNAFVSSQRAAAELVNVTHPANTTTLSAADMLDPAGASSRYNPGSTDLPDVLSPDQLPLLSASGAAALRQAIQYRYHDLTAYSSSVLADTYAGGLKKDLSALLASGAALPAAGDFLFTPEPNVGATISSYAVPTWGQLRSFATTRTSATRELLPQLPTVAQAGISPVLTYAGVGFQYVSAGGVGDPIQLALYPIAVLWNPYNATLKGAKYEMGLTRRYSGMVQLQAHTPAKTSPWTIKETRNFVRGGGLVTGGAAANADGSANLTSTATGTTDTSTGIYLRFVIDAQNEDLAPGESMIFTLSGNQTYNAPMTGAPANELRKGIRITAHALMPAASSVAAGETEFRVGIYGKNDANRTLFSPATLDGHFSGSESDAYLGQVASSGADGYGLETGPNGVAKPWFQSISRVFGGKKSGSDVLDGTTAYTSILQGPGPLPTVATGPEFLIAVRARFSTAGAARWIAQGNPRAPIMTRANPDGGTAPGYYGYADGAEWQDFSLAPSGHVSSGSSLDSGTAITNTTLFEYLPEDQPLLSLGQLQHASLSLLGSYPSYPLGNSLADYRFKGTTGDFLGRLHRTDGWGATSFNAPTHLIVAYYDVSYLLNRALWDRYFVSTVPHPGTGIPGDTAATPVPVTPGELPNPRYLRQAGISDADLRDGDRAAAGLLLAGGFNINSTSEQAWRAVLGGINRLPYDPIAGGTGSPLRAALPRFAKPTATIDPGSAPWQGYRQLDDVQIAQLARNIVAEIRKRGPFVSLGDFVNRRLRDNPATTPPASPPQLNADERAKGVIQSAIDATVSGATATNAGSAAPFSAAAPFTVNGVTYSGGSYTDANLMRGGPANVAPYGSRAAFAPQFLTQADVLSAIGAGLSARSDTFVIRTCGEVVNPVLASSDPGYITGRAWCEAIVQRVVEPVRRKSAVTADADYNEPAAATPTQPDFGRRFKVVAFRWLGPNDI